MYRGLGMRGEAVEHQRADERNVFALPNLSVYVAITACQGAMQLDNLRLYTEYLYVLLYIWRDTKVTHKFTNYFIPET